MATPRLSLRHARLFMENAFLDLLDILAWQEGTTPGAATLTRHPGAERPADGAGPRRAAIRR
ncbi:hypothetical protein CFR78_08115 [Komagataeibacter rhaeticus]|uniref:Uncharacterized protein n=1 Tax=Komagataeibacter rhaeticus TaxID=215221 RepID=A0A181CAY6_9PROT|nr:hypothetical protein [Komagataeibacter rhaeticus]ATU72625.1 hypothetical protein CT154_06995 [Komagataeibacter xylinus]EGG74627.1 hypothetical protein SXCC_04731 [Gluconacetobacter sp. SXCC-1]KDU94659.1 hypothetical protein GLUCORHAEAF1_13210 [Komagataeibacter rhaeticus AF1]MBL7240279.1 hypothetical protein [Komagataeibacter rhaeticus]PYD53592.1 hypothetical protein CFR78_08115 [Komagataeibacter rhaeticus]